MRPSAGIINGIEEKKKLADVNRLDRPRCRNHHERAPRIAKRNVARSLLPVSNSEMFGDGFQVFNPPVLGMTPHPSEDFRCVPQPGPMVSRAVPTYPRAFFTANTIPGHTPSRE